jgi:transcriptional regulator with XRE-family HTH domain
MNTFGSRLRASRQSKKLNQEQLAELIGAANTSVSEWENGRHRPGMDQINKLCNVLEVDPNWLYGEEYSKILRETPAEYYLSGNGEELPEEAKKELDNFIEYLKAKYKGSAEK